MSEMTALHVMVYGRVQGVYYRMFTQRQAVRLGLQGYVRNLPDRSVEVHAEGERKQLEQLLEILQKGPPGARVDTLKTSWLECTGKYRDFSVTG
jgi:acylphosphatase